MLIHLYVWQKIANTYASFNRNVFLTIGIIPMGKHFAKRVAVTGMGVICAMGATLPEFSQGLFRGADGIGPISLFDATGFQSKYGGQVAEKYLNRPFEPRRLKRTSRCDLLGLIAAGEALAGADDGRLPYERDRIGVVLGGGAGGMLSWERFRKTLFEGRRRPSPSLVLASAPCTLTDLIANQYDFRGIRSTITTACSSSANAIGYAYDLIQAGILDAAITGGSEALSELTFSGFNALKVMSPEPCRPFDKNRSGLSLGEGAGILILEKAATAQKRGARIYAELLGYALNSDAYHMTSPDPEGEGMLRVMRAALKHAQVDADRVDYVNAHGTATKMNDRVESMAIHSVFGDRSLEEVYVSSTKSMVGHCLGASGAIEAIATALALDTQQLPPTIRLENPDPECRLNHVANVGKKQKIRVAISNSFAFGGNNTCLVFGHAG